MFFASVLGMVEALATDALPGLRIAGEQVAGDPMLARVLGGADQILIQHFAQVRLQLRRRLLSGRPAPCWMRRS